MKMFLAAFWAPKGLIFWHELIRSFAISLMLLFGLAVLGLLAAQSLITWAYLALAVQLIMATGSRLYFGDTPPPQSRFAQK
ncbi:hypothetical protein [Motilimonas pumila]|uniref:Uncharacterized protein n=1 Tax=Motilimonas pumila TaxID=2303987 RepID=A0A418Y9R6_9GAMM|nr:hypothetical protein [Motilimonas pumila]RJG38169.1 hypothetical protein D1Z90_19275 [Motilimonas pumila]